jgi:hypothetical protein
MINNNLAVAGYTFEAPYYEQRHYKWPESLSYHCSLHKQRLSENVQEYLPYPKGQRVYKQQELHRTRIWASSELLTSVIAYFKVTGRNANIYERHCKVISTCFQGKMRGVGYRNNINAPHT